MRKYCVGLCDGKLVDGAVLGKNEGHLIGAIEEDTDGLLDGFTLDRLDGLCDGVRVIVTEGLAEGSGFNIGIELGWIVGSIEESIIKLVLVLGVSEVSRVG